MNSITSAEIQSFSDFHDEYEKDHNYRELKRIEKLQAMKLGFERWLIKKVTAGGSALSIMQIYPERKVIDLGLYAISLSFLEPIQNVYLSVLVHWYKYIPMQSQYEIVSLNGFKNGK